MEIAEGIEMVNTAVVVAEDPPNLYKRYFAHFLSDCN
jgi:hypothetical protein